MDLDIISNYFALVVMCGSLIAGYSCKKWIKNSDNKYIPTIVAIDGLS